jgi:hypothetical protein
MKLSLLILGVAWAANAATYYVATTGSDAYTTVQAQNPATPWLTVQKAEDNSAAGDTIIVASGLYTQRVAIRTSGSAGSPIVYTNSGSAFINGGFDLQASYVTIHGFEIQQTNYQVAAPTVGAGIYCKGSYNQISSNNVHDAAWYGIYAEGVSDGSGAATNCTILGNLCRSNLIAGIYCAGNTNLVVWNEISDSVQHAWFCTNDPGYLDADGIRFFGTNNVFRSNYIHSISGGWTNGASYNLNPHVDAFQTYHASTPPTLNTIIECNLVYLTNTTTNVWTTNCPNGFMVQKQTTVPPESTTIRNNVIHAIRGITADRTLGLYVYNNVFRSDLAYNYPALQGSGIAFTSTNTEIINNIFVDQIASVIYPNYDCTNSLSCSNNIVFSSTGAAAPTSGVFPAYWRARNYWDTNAVFASYVTNGVSNYRLQSSSYAIGHGAVLGSFTTDADGNTRGPLWDVGPYEWQPVSTATANTLRAGTLIIGP